MHINLAQQRWSLRSASTQKPSMRLSTFTDYSLRVLMYLAVRPGERATIAGIAKAFDISEHHLVKVVHFLGRGGWLANVRGKGGGLELAQPPESIGVGDVVRYTEGADIMAECFDAAGSECSIASACRLQGMLGEAAAAFHAVLDRYTIADCVRNRAQLAKILFLKKA
jgi:Rrf2 family nitric oxide-sensitive transcriptional repressor